MSIPKKILFALLAVVILIPSVIVFSFAEENEPSLGDIYRDPYGKTMICSNKGYVRFAPENSFEAVSFAVAAGADIVKIDIKKTADDVLILMADDTVTRTTAGYGEETAVNKLSFDEISKLSLLQGRGGALAEKTDCKVPSLKSIFINKENCLYLLDASWSIKDDIYALAAEYDMLGSVIFLFKDAKPGDVALWKESVGDEIMTMTYFKGNVIFSALSHLKKSEQASQSVFFATKVSSGVVFGETVTKKADGKLRLCADLTDNSLCGKLRQDTEVWWNEIISRGYSIVITDYVSELKEYIDNCEIKRDRLQNVYDEIVGGWTLPDFKSDNYLDYKTAYNNALSSAEKLLKDGSSAASDLATAIFELQKAYDNINDNYESIKNGTVGMTVTPVRVLLAVAAVVAVVCAEIFVYKKKKKN